MKLHFFTSIKQIPFICLLTLTLFSNCSSGDKSHEDIVKTIPQELKDTTVLQADEDNALEKLNNVIDTSKKEK